MVHAIRIHEHGGPEVMKWEEIEVGEPGEGQVRIKHHAVGLNYIDTYHRSGLYKISLPAVIGTEGAGEVTAVGPGVTEFKVGDRVAYASPIGAYAEERLIPADRLVKIPDNIDYQTAAAMMLQGMTVRYLLKETYKVGPGTTMLLHAAAGGIGLIACQWARALGVKLIGTVSSPEKAELALANGAWKVIDYSRENVVERVLELTGGKKVPVVYDGVGKDTWEVSLDCLEPRGLMVSFGNASGPVTGVNLGILAQKGSLFVTRPTLGTHVSTPEKLKAAADELFDLVRKKKIQVRIDQRYSLAQAAEAHAALAARKTTGATVFTLG